MLCWRPPPRADRRRACHIHLYNLLLQGKALNAPATNYCQMLQEIAEDQRFEVTYVDIQELNAAGKARQLMSTILLVLLMYAERGRVTYSKWKLIFIRFFFLFLGYHQCLVQLSTMPVAVCHGIGKTKDEARGQAAHNALQYLKIMTKKS